MTAWLLAAILLGNPTPPPDYYDRLPGVAKSVIRWVAQDRGVFIPELEKDAPGSFKGAVYVWRMRYNGTPLPYYHDPVFGRP